METSKAKAYAGAYKNYLAVEKDLASRLLAQQETKKYYSLPLEEAQKREANKKNAKPFPVIIKADTIGSLEAITTALKSFPTDEVLIQIVTSGIGPVTSSEVENAALFGARILGFGAKPASSVARDISVKRVTFENFDLIYKLFDYVRLLLEDALPPSRTKIITGTAEIRAVFGIDFGRVELPVAGCYVTDGSIAQGALYHVLRNGQVLYESEAGGIKSLRIFKETVKEVKKNFECGINLDLFYEFEVGDVIESFVWKIDRRKLSPDIFVKPESQ